MTAIELAPLGASLKVLPHYPEREGKGRECLVTEQALSLRRPPLTPALLELCDLDFFNIYNRIEAKSKLVSQPKFNSCYVPTVDELFIVPLLASLEVKQARISWIMLQ